MDKWVGAQREALQDDISGHVALASISGLRISAVDELKLKPGEAAYAVIKASDVIVGIN